MRHLHYRHFDSKADLSLSVGALPLPVCRTIDVGGAPAYLRGLKLLFVSDVHLRDRVSDARLKRFMDILRAAGADMLLLGGDYAESPDALRRFFEALAPLPFRYGKFAAPGNHDFCFMDRLERCANSGGCVLLRNSCARVDVKGGTLQIAGCEDHRFGRPVTRGLFHGGGYRILLSHFPVMPDCACELMLSGHTHAGQFAIGHLSPYTLLEIDSGLEFLEVRGFHRFGEMNCLIGNGVGMSGPALRIGARPEIYLLSFV